MCLLKARIINRITCLVKRLYFFAFLVIFGCKGYEAPLVNQSKSQVLNPPIIIDSGATRSELRALRVQPRVDSSSSRDGDLGSVKAKRGRQVHTVKEGDTLYSIAYQYDIDFRKLALSNNLIPPYVIYTGRELSLGLNNEDAGASVNSSSITAGKVVSDNAVARTNAGSRGGGVLRRSLSSKTLDDIRWNWPHKASILRGFSSESKGLDISGRLGEDVLAAASGEVVYAGQGVQGSGNLVIVRHTERYLSAYAHNSVMIVSVGAKIQGGDKIAEIGQNLDGEAMLHFEIREDGTSIDPQIVLPE